MDVPLFITLRYRGSSKLMMINRKTTIDSIRQEFRGEWNNLNQDEFSLNFSVGNNINNSSLRTDEDVRNMVLCCDQLGLALATVNANVSYEPRASIHSGAGGSGGDFMKQGCSGKGNGGGVNIGCDGEEYFGNKQGSTKRHVDAGNSTKRHVQNYGENADDFEGSGALPTYVFSPPLVAKPLLNDGWGLLIKGKGQLFTGGALEFRDKLVKYTTKLGFSYEFKRNDSRYVHVKCTEEVSHKCQWFVKAGRQPHNQVFVINDCNLQHECVGKKVSNKRNRLGAAVLGRMFTENIRQDPTTRARDVKGVVKTSYGMDISDSRAHRTVGYSKGEIFGTYANSYNNIPWYGEAVKKTNPGSVVVVEREADSTAFKRLFIAFKGSLDAFKTCRPMLFTDGTFTSGRAKGTILAATAKDGNNGLVPVAFAVVSAENLENWQWFLEMLRDHVKHDEEIFYISDRHAGLMSAFPKVFAKPRHFFCLQHLKNNLQKLFGGQGCGVRRERAWDLFKDIAYAPNIALFDEKMKIFKEECGTSAAHWIDTLPVEKWSLAHSTHILRYGEMTSNAIESFNFWIVGARGLPVTYMVDTIRMGLMRWFVERREEGSKWKGVLCQNKEEHWNALSEMGSTWNVLECPNGEYEVLCETSVRINLGAKKCSCYTWQIRGFPCVHAVAVIRKVCNNISEVVDPYFLTKTYQKTYSYSINPIPQTEKFECLPYLQDEPYMSPPESDSVLGRPPGKRRKSCFEIRRKKAPAKCPKCGLVTRHDVFTCGL